MKIEFDLSYERFVSLLQEERALRQKLTRLGRLGMEGLVNDICEEFLNITPALYLFSEVHEDLSFVFEHEEFDEVLESGNKCKGWKLQGKQFAFDQKECSNSNNYSKIRDFPGDPGVKTPPSHVGSLA